MTSTFGRYQRQTYLGSQVRLWFASSRFTKQEHYSIRRAYGLINWCFRSWKKKVWPWLLEPVPKKTRSLRKRYLCLTLGEPDFTTPKISKMPPLHRFQDGRCLHTVTSGLRNWVAIKCYAQATFTAILARQWWQSAAGAKYSLYTFFMAVVNPGDEVIIPTLLGQLWRSGQDGRIYQSLFLLRRSNHCKVTVEQLDAPSSLNEPRFWCWILHQSDGMIYTREELFGNRELGCRKGYSHPSRWYLWALGL